MIAAFDYRRYASEAQSTNRPSLLFIAHREEILKQALETFRHVLKDSEFGDLLVGGHRPDQSRHLFCSVQSWHARDLNKLAPDHFDYVVLDEAHHAAASSYQAIIDHIRPQVLLGLTATPERTDGRDIRDDFGGRYTHELRLPDAIEARRLAPFHYFGIHDAEGVDLSGLAWQRGGYRTDDLDRVIGGNERRARWVLTNLLDHVADPERFRALGFCVSQVARTVHGPVFRNLRHSGGIPDRRFATAGAASRAARPDRPQDPRHLYRGPVQRRRGHSGSRHRAVSCGPPRV
jgi:superfamily II DNA or RNA helicase